MENIKIPIPTNREINKYLTKWAGLENYVLQESSLKKLFTKTYPRNDKIDDVLIKVCALNDFYSTNIFSPFTVAKHIVALNIDEKLAAADLPIVNKIAIVRMRGGQRKNFYSFATKYCSHHKPAVYPIYDSYVEKMLLYFNKLHKFSVFYKADLRLYPLYKRILSDFRKFFSLESFSLKQIDQYLWQAGKKYFPKNFGKKK